MWPAKHQINLSPNDLKAFCAREFRERCGFGIILLLLLLDA